MKIKKVLGEGSYGSVVICEKNNKDYALKTVKGDCFGLVSLQEIDIMNSVYNPFITSARKTYIDDNSIMIFMDLADETLHRYKIRDESELRMIAFQMVCSLAFLENRNIVHGDIKANNFLCFKNSNGFPLNVRLTDFSLSCRSYGKDIPPLFKMFCSIYRPVEAWFSKASCKSDVWALGCCLYELLTGDNQLFPGQDERYDKDIVYDLKVSKREVHKRWRISNDAYLTALYKFANATNQKLTSDTLDRLKAAESRIAEFNKPLNLFVRDWVSVYNKLPKYIRSMLIVEPALRPSAITLFESDVFAKERQILSKQLTKFYMENSRPCSEIPEVLLDGTIKQHVTRNGLEYEEIQYFLNKHHYHRLSRIAAMDIFSKCKHIGNGLYIIQACLLISIKITDPSSLDWYEYDRQTELEKVFDNYVELDLEEELNKILEAERLICQGLNYVLYPESSDIFEFTDEQLVAFYV